jgi:hypothetical protein
MKPIRLKSVAFVALCAETPRLLDQDQHLRAMRRAWLRGGVATTKASPFQWNQIGTVSGPSSIPETWLTTCP